MQTLEQMFREYEDEAAKRTRAEMAREQAEWDDYSDEQRNRISQSRAERVESLFCDADDRAAGHDEDDY